MTSGGGWKDGDGGAQMQQGAGGQIRTELRSLNVLLDFPLSISVPFCLFVLFFYLWSAFLLSFLWTLWKEFVNICFVRFCSSKPWVSLLSPADFHTRLLYGTIFNSEGHLLRKSILHEEGTLTVLFFCLNLRRIHPFPDWLPIFRSLSPGNMSDFSSVQV